MMITTERAVSHDADDDPVRGTDELADEICALAAHMTAATCRWLLLVAEFDRSEAWGQAYGITSCAHWLSWRCGIALGTARDQVRVARRLPDLPVTTARFATGELSYAKVRALVRIATPANEAALVDMALEMTASQLEQMVMEFKASEREALGKAAERRIRRFLRYRYDRDGNMVITACVPPEDGAMVIDLLEQLVREDDLEHAEADTVDDVPAGMPQRDVSAETACADVSAETRETGVSAETRVADVSAETPVEPDNRIEPSPGERARASALVAMARRAATTLGDDVVATADRAHLLITVDARSVAAVSSGACHLEHGPALAVETACRLGCEGTMAVLVNDAVGNPLHLGDTTPTVSRRQKRALLARDHHCRFPGCGRRRYLHAHHIVHWSRGGRTCISNLVLVCSRHHRLVHEGGFGVSGTSGNVVFTRPDGTPIEQVPPGVVGDGATVVAQNTQLGLTITADTPGSLSNGERLDRGLASDWLWLLLHPETVLGPRPAPLDPATVLP